MAINYDKFIHPLDRKALNALKAVPGFDLLVKKYMNVLGEKIFKIETTSSYLKLGNDQIPEIYNILIKVCNKLEIPIPELYLKLDRSPNACTYGDTDIFIVLNSGLLETMTLEQIETIIAHECGHIACHHVLYRTMGYMILDGADFFSTGLISKTIITSLQFAFAHWMRCSEFSADRVSAYYHNSSEKVINVMMALSGGTSNLKYDLNPEAFIKQAENYKDFTDNSKYNKILEFIQFGLIDHPLNAYRAYEIKQFSKDFLEKNYNFTQEDDTTNTQNDNNTKQNLDDKDSDNTNTNSNDLENKFILTIEYNYIKPKSSIKYEGLFGAGNLKVKINNKNYVVNKNSKIDIILPSGNFFIHFANNLDSTDYNMSFTKNTSLTVTWDSDEDVLSVVQ